MNWLLLRGLGREKSHWYKFPKMIEENLETKVLALNLPGISKDESNIPIKINEITDSVREEWLKQKGEGPWGLLGISLGGMIAIDWCHRYPEDFKQLVTINSSSAAHSHPFKRISPLALKTLISLIFMKDMREREKRVLELTTNQTTIDDALLDHWMEVANNVQISKKVFLTQLLAASKFMLPKKLTTPYTVLTSKADRFTHYTCSEKLAAHFNAQIHYHETAGHDLPLDDSMWIIDKLKNV